MKKPIFTGFLNLRKLATVKATSYLKKTEELSKKHIEDLTMYGVAYKNTYEHDYIELQISWLEFKATFLIELFNLNRK